MDVHTILWPTDLSPSSIAAAPQVLELSEKYGASIVLLYVGVDICSYFPAYGNYPSRDRMQEFQGWEIEQAKKRMEKLCDEELKTCPNVFIRLAQGNPVDQILKKIKEESVDLIVLPTKGYGDIRRGSGGTLSEVVEQVVLQSPVPVMTLNT